MNKYLRNLLFLSTFLTTASVYGDLPQPYNSVNNLPQTPYFVLDGYVYYNLINTSQAAVIIDIDSQDGGVARFVAQQAPNLPTVTQIFSISMWQTKEPSQKFLFQKFLSNVKQENTTNLITPIRMSSLEAANSLNITADFISLVGANNRDEIYAEILAWFPHLSNNGTLCGNNWYDKSVQSGVTRAATALDLTLHVNDNVWYFQKTPSS